MTRNAILAASAGGAVALGLTGWAAAAALHPPRAPSSAGRVMEVRYEVHREPAYVPPPPVEATRLDVLDLQSPTVIEDGVLSAQAGQALRDIQAEDARRNAAALASIRAEDARIDRDTAAALSTSREDAQGASEGTSTPQTGSVG